MLNLIVCLFCGWLLSLFGLDDLIVNAINELFNKNFGEGIYYLLFFIPGVIADLIDAIKSNPQINNIDND